MTHTDSFAIAIDTGGTFTDLVLAGAGAILGLFKAATTPADPFEGISVALKTAADAQALALSELLARTDMLVYSTTYSTNAIITGTTARTALLSTRGHRDVLLYKEGGKDQVFNWSMPFPKPYVPRNLTFELTERVLADGSIAVPLDEAEVRRTLRRLGELEIESIAVCLLWSPVQPIHELRIGELIEEELPDVDYSLSHRVNRAAREYRRASATAIDASLKPLMRGHLADLENRLRELGFDGHPLMVTHVSGGVMQLEQMSQVPLQTVDSGPALAPIAAREIANQEQGLPHDGVLVVDTGGTSFDVSLILDGRLAYTREKWLGPRWYGMMTGLPAVDTQSVGAGGGSIAWVDAGGLLQVGPESAGADPGPVCYGRGGTKPTVTDAAVVLGYIDPEYFLGGTMRLDRDEAYRAIAERLAEPLGMTPEASAEAVVVVASELMRAHVTELIVARGQDPRRCVLVAGGGAAGLNIVRIARDLEIPHLMIPRLAAGLSSLGGQFADITATFSRAHHTTTTAFDFAGVSSVITELDDELEDFLTGVRYDGEREKRFGCEARYDQQLWEIDVDLGRCSSVKTDADVTAIKHAFDRNHARLFGSQHPASPLEIITWRGEARVIRAKPSLVRQAEENGRSVGESAVTRQVYFAGEALDTPIFHGRDLAGGTMVHGPAIIEEETTTIVLIRGSVARAKDSHYVISVGTASSTEPENERASGKRR